MKIDLDLTDILTLKFLVIEKLDTYKTEKLKLQTINSQLMYRKSLSIEKLKNLVIY